MTYLTTESSPFDMVRQVLAAHGAPQIPIHIRYVRTTKSDHGSNMLECSAAVIGRANEVLLPFPTSNETAIEGSSNINVILDGAKLDLALMQSLERDGIVVKLSNSSGRIACEQPEEQENLQWFARENQIDEIPTGFVSALRSSQWHHNVCASVPIEFFFVHSPTSFGYWQQCRITALQRYWRHCSQKITAAEAQNAQQQTLDATMYL